jgi:uncharacterized lipoprotein YbaY
VRNTYLVKGEIVLPTTGLPAKPVDVIVSVEDTSRADAPAVVVGQQRQRNVLLREGLPVPFMVEIPADRIDERHTIRQALISTCRVLVMLRWATLYPRSPIPSLREVMERTFE